MCRELGKGTQSDATPRMHGRRFMAFDRHLNLVLADSEEFRRLPPKKGKSADEVRSMQQLLSGHGRKPD